MLMCCGGHLRQGWLQKLVQLLRNKKVRVRSDAQRGWGCRQEGWGAGSASPRSTNRLGNSDPGPWSCWIYTNIIDPRAGGCFSVRDRRFYLNEVTGQQQLRATSHNFFPRMPFRMLQNDTPEVRPAASEAHPERRDGFCRTLTRNPAAVASHGFSRASTERAAANPPALILTQNWLLIKPEDTQVSF